MFKEGCLQSLQVRWARNTPPSRGTSRERKWSVQTPTSNSDRALGAPRNQLQKSLCRVEKYASMACFSRASSHAAFLRRLMELKAARGPKAASRSACTCSGVWEEDI